MPNFDNGDKEHFSSANNPKKVMPKDSEDCELKSTKLDALLKREYSPTEWIVKDLVPEDAVVLMSAHPASFKTWLSLDLSLKVAAGEDFLGHFSTQKTGVLILDAESGGRQIQKRYNLLGANPDLPVYYKHFISPEVDRDFMSSIIVECAKYDIKLVIFDSLTRFFKGNENDASDVSDFFENLSFLKQARITSLLICHNRKGGADSYNNSYSFTRNESFAVRGSSNIVASCDMHLAISRCKDSNSIRITQTKNRLDKEITPFIARFAKDSDTEVHWEYIETSQDARSKIKSQIYDYLMSNPGKNQKEICNYIMLNTEISIGEKAIRELLKDLVTDNGLRTERGNRTELLYYVRDEVEGGWQNGN